MNPTERFEGRADAYRIGRPSYGPEVIGYVLDGLGAAPTIADLGAGTGIASRLLAAYGANVIAIEPNAKMRAQAEPNERVRFVEAPAESTGLADGSVDGITAFQAFHWFANDAALAEIVRIGRAGATAALVLNERDERDPVSAAYGDLVRRFATDDTEAQRMASIVRFKALPGIVSERVFSSEQRLGQSDLHARIDSTSYLPNAGEAATRLGRDADAFFRLVAQQGVVRLALHTIVVRVQLP